MKRPRTRAPAGWVAGAVLLLGLVTIPGGMTAGLAGHGATPASGRPGTPSSAAITRFEQNVQPVLKEFCFDCHGDGANKGKVAFDGFSSPGEMLAKKDLWFAVLKNVRAGLMPPVKKPRPAAPQRAALEQWIKSDVFGLDPADPDPGRVTVRRLNRVEYRNTIRDLLGVDFDSEREFPPDDTGHGFDNIGDVLTLPPMLLEKYLVAARTIVSKAVPASPRVPAESVLTGRSFRGDDVFDRTNRGSAALSTRSLSYYERAAVSNRFHATQAGHYQLLVDLTANERFVDGVFDYNKCRVVFKADGRELLHPEYTREGGKAFHYETEQEWQAGEHELVLEVYPLTPDQKQVRSLSIRLDSVTVRGPLEAKFWVRPKSFDRFFTQDAPKGAGARRRYAREVLTPFVTRAYRRPVDSPTIDRLVALAESTYRQRGKTFEAGIGQAMVAVLASPRFLFREEGVQAVTEVQAGAPAGAGRSSAGVPVPAAGLHPWVDEYALASRLSYFFWSSMPDAELFRLAGEGRLRRELSAQARRMLEDRRSEAFVRNFVGQWLQTRDIETVSIDARQVLAREAAPDGDFDRRRQRFRDLRDKPEEQLTAAEKKEMDELRGTLFRRFQRPLRAELNGDLRRAMRQETERTFEYVIRENRSLLELIDSDYTFLNERLARHYGLTNLNVTGEEMVLVKLPPDSVRGGIITDGSVLAVTANPTRTSPVKRGLFILDNILGTPPPPPPPDIPPLEDAAKAIRDRPLSLRETLALHREQPLCSSCHDRMDPLGLALENFNAMGMWRNQERNQPIDATGRLLSGESFTNITQLKRILATRHAAEFYRTITEKLLTYALGRGLEYYDVATVDAIVERLMENGGRASALLAGIVESAPFQKTRVNNPQLAGGGDGGGGR